MKANMFITLSLAAMVASIESGRAETVQHEIQIERGRYLVKIAGCNDCHTAGYGLSNGEVPESEWLKGDPTGWHGPWGTTYAINLRQLVHGMSEDAWINTARTVKARPPMPWYAIRDMEEGDLKAIYKYIRSLGPDEAVVPSALPPGQKPEPPYFELVLPAPK